MKAEKLNNETQREIISRASALVARSTSPNGLLSRRDIADITGFSYNGRTIFSMLHSPDFPAPITVGTREKRWVSGEVFAWLKTKQRA